MARFFQCLILKIFTIWFEHDRQDADNKMLAEDEKLTIDLARLKDFTGLFSNDMRFYYGSDTEEEGSIRFITLVKNILAE